MNDDAVIQVAQTHAACQVLGPGRRFVVWVQGCGIGCAECVSPQWIPFSGGRAEPIGALAARIIHEADDGLTLSGGEPFAQADRLADLIETIRQQRDLSIMSYSGYTIEHLRAHGSAGQRRLLSLMDILIDGPFLANRLSSLRWRGSTNQRMHLLTDRHRDLADEADASAGLQFEVDQDGCLRWLGVPTVPRFRQRLEERLGLIAHSEPSPKEVQP